MVNKLVSVGDDLTLPDDVKVADGNLPARLADTALNATYGPTAPGMVNAFASKVAGWDDAVSDAVNSWHTQPRSLYNSLRDRVYQGVVSEDGTIGISVHDRRRRKGERVNLGRYGVDDHNCPAFLFEDDKPPLVAIVQHAVESAVRVRIGSAPHNYRSLETASETQVAFPGACTYAHLMRKTATNTVALGTRNEDGWYKRISADWGTTWGTVYPFHTSAYATFRKDGHYAHYVTYSHPITTPNNSIRYFKINFDDGVITNASGVVIGNFFTDTSAVPNASMTLARQSYDTDAGHNTDRVFDVGHGGSIAAMQFDKNLPEAGGMYGVYRFASAGATAPSSGQSPDDPQRGWVFEPIVQSGVPVGYYQSSYVGGMCFGETDNIVYLDRESVGKWLKERWAKVSGVWTRTHVLVEKTNGTKLGRPQVPWGAEGTGVVAGIEYFYYPTDTFLGYYGDQLIYNTSLGTALPVDTTPPSVPSGLSATPGQLSAILDWGDVTGAAGYHVYQGASLKATVSASMVTITGLTEGVPYSFYVSAFDEAGNESAKAAFASVNPGPRILTADELLPNGTLVLIDPTHSLGSWSSGVPTATVTNLARDKALAVVGAGVASDYDFTVSNTLTAADGAMSRTSKGGLAVIASQSTAAQNRNYAMACEKIRAFIAANPTHSYFLSVWETPTRLSLEATPGTLQRNVGFLSGASSDTISARLATGNKLTVAPSSNRLGVKESPTPAVVGTPINVNAGYSSVTAPGSDPTFVMMGTANSAGVVNKAPSWVLYHIRLEDLTVSGRSYATAAELDQIEFDQAFKAGARYNGDTYTAVSTLP